MRILVALTACLLAAAVTGDIEDRSAADPTCTPSCDVHGLFAGYVSPVTIVESGASVVWDTLDTVHIQAQSPVQSTSTCFLATSSPGEPSSPVRFDFDGSTLSATHEGNTQTCANWVGLPDGSAMMLYFCTLHPNMQAVLIIGAAPADALPVTGIRLTF